MDELTKLCCFETSLLLKRQLSLVPPEELIEVYVEDIESYKLFVHYVIILLETEAAFLFLSNDFISSIRKVVEVHRFDLNDKTITDEINHITKCLNQIENTSMDLRLLTIKAYRSYHEDLRQMKFNSNEDFVDYLCNDTLEYFALKCETDEDKDIVIDDKYAIASIKYFMEEIPIFFDDPDIMQRAEDRLNLIINNAKFFEFSKKNESKNVKRKLKSLYEEE